MNAVVITVGNELLAGDIENTNATWLAAALTDRGVDVARIVVVPDDEPVVAARVRVWAAEFDAVLVTGGLGGTPDDVTMPAVADGLDRELVVDPIAESDVQAKIDRIYAENPELDFDLRAEWYASMPADATPIPNPEGLAPGCVAENVYVLPGIPEEMKATFGNVADDFAGDVVTRTLYSPEPEGALASPLGELTDRYEVRVGSYPNRSADRTRITVTGGGDAVVAEAVSWLRDRAEIPLESAGGDDGSDVGGGPTGSG